MMEIMSRSLATWRHMEVIRGTYRRSRRSSRAGFSIFAGKTLKKEEYNFNSGPEELENKWGFCFSCVWAGWPRSLGGGNQSSYRISKGKLFIIWMRKLHAMSKFDILTNMTVRICQHVSVISFTNGDSCLSAHTTFSVAMVQLFLSLRNSMVDFEMPLNANTRVSAKCFWCICI